MKKNVKHSVLWALTITLLLGSVITACAPTSSDPLDTTQEITGQVEVNTNNTQDPAAFQLGGRQAFRVAVQICGNRCLGVS